MTTKERCTHSRVPCPTQKDLEEDLLVTSRVCTSKVMGISRDNLGTVCMLFFGSIKQNHGGNSQSFTLSATGLSFVGWASD